MEVGHNETQTPPTPLLVCRRSFSLSGWVAYGSFRCSTCSTHTPSPTRPRSPLATQLAPLLVPLDPPLSSSCVCVCVFIKLKINHSIRPCHPSHSTPVSWRINGTYYEKL
ncbi:unnamed protein product [Ascophyllum nodosum]